jgi:adenosylcobinamide-GDP ribazoletransferase
MRGLLAALSFLTTVPIPERWLGQELIPPRAMLWWWVPVGALIGGLSAGAAYLTHLALPWSSCAVVGAVAWVALSGGLHLEGFMDTCDGLGSRAHRERALEIMKDSRAGAFGVIGALCLILLTLALLTGLPPRLGLAALALGPVLGRLAQVVVLETYPYARPEGGMGGAFFEAAGSSHTLAAALLTLAAAVGVSLACAEIHLPLALLPVGLGLAWWSAIVARRLGGHTGDTVGAASEIAQMLSVLGVILVKALYG